MAAISKVSVMGKTLPAAFATIASLIAVMVFCGCGKTGRPSATQPVAATIDRANWMRDHLATFGNKTLRQLALPASHDSAMYLTGFPQSLARTQNLTIYGQLTAGVRWFDLRPQYRDGGLATSHGPVSGPKLSVILADIRRFMAERHRELVMLKFSHYDGFTVSAYAAMARQINKSLSPWLLKTLPPGKRLADIRLRDYLANGGAILVFCDGQYPIDSPSAGIWVYRDWDSDDPQLGDLRVYDQYSNTLSYPTMKSDQLSKFAAFNGACKHRPDLSCDLFLLSWTLTPPTDVPAFAAEPNRQLASVLKTLKIPNPAGFFINLIYTDCDEVIQLNQRSP
jgi:hypothetical protein